MSPNDQLFIVIVGCGRLGSYLANKLSHEGHSIVTIDLDEGAFISLSAEYSGFRVEGDAIEFGVLQQAKTDKADLVIAATSDDNVNLMVAQVAKKLFNVPRVIARVLEPKRAEIYRHLGIETVCPTSIAADALLEAAALPREAVDKGQKE